MFIGGGGELSLSHTHTHTHTLPNEKSHTHLYIYIYMYVEKARQATNTQMDRIKLNGHTTHPASIFSLFLTIHVFTYKSRNLLFDQSI